MVQFLALVAALMLWVSLACLLFKELAVEMVCAKWPFPILDGAFKKSKARFMGIY